MTSSRFIITVAAVVLLSCQTAQTPAPRPGVSKPEAAARQTHDAKTFFETTRIAGASFSHDEERILLSSDRTGIFNAYSQPVPGGAPRQLTRSRDHAIFGRSWFPDDDRFLFTADEGGNELNHLFVMTPDGKRRDLTPGKKLKAHFVDWSQDRRRFWVITNERDPRFFDLYRYSVSGYERTRLFTNEKGWQIGAISRDGRWLCLAKVNDNADSDLYLKDLRKPAAPPLHISKHEGKALHRALTFTPDHRELYYLTDAHGEYFQAWSYDIERGEHRLAFKDDWDVSFVHFSESGRYRVTGVNADARTVVTVLDMKSKAKVPLPDLAGDIKRVTISRSEKKLAFYVNSDTSPSNLHVFDLETRKHAQLTRSLNPAIRQEDLVAGRVVRYESFDRLKIPAILYRPHGASAARKVPALVWVHGGPGGQSRKGYRPLLQHLINHGYAILAVNNRGSSGYGKTFFHLDDRRHGDVDLKDCIHARKYLEGLPWIDGARVGIIGGSYGGFMVVAALAFAPKAFDVGIDIFGVTNWIRTLEKIPAWWAAYRKSLYAEMGDPKKDGARLRRISPLFHADKIERPLLVIQGANDPRVLKVESDEIVAAVKKKNVPVEYLVFPDEGHGFRKRDNMVRAAETYLRFLDRHMRGSKSVR